MFDTDYFVGSAAGFADGPSLPEEMYFLCAAEAGPGGPVFVGAAFPNQDQPYFYDPDGEDGGVGWSRAPKLPGGGRDGAACGVVDSGG